MQIYKGTFIYTYINILPINIFIHYYINIHLNSYDILFFEAW